MKPCDEAVYLLKGNKNPRSVINRLYYAMFYAVLALLVYEQFASSKHRGVISFFNKKFIKDGIFPKEMGKALYEAFELRLSSDYGEYIIITEKQVEPFFDKTRGFIDAIREYINNTYNSEISDV